MGLFEKVKLLEGLESYSSANELQFRLSTDYMLNGYHLEHLQNLCELVLVLAGEKPATIIDTVIPLWKEKVLRLLDSIALPYHQGEREPETRPGQFVIYTAKDTKWLGRIMAASTNGDRGELGRCFGFPETAIQAYLGERQRLERVVAEGLTIRAVTSFVCSADFWWKEAEVLERWNDTLATLSPKLYQAAETYRNS